MMFGFRGVARSQSASRVKWARGSLLAAAAAVALVGAGCGGSDKPAYCSNVNDFKTAVDDLGNVNVAGGASSVKASVDKVESTGTAAVNSAKSDFPDETTALKSSLAALGATTKQLTDPATLKAALKQLPAEISAVQSSAKTFEDATKSKCS
jgi:hypothetical protein